MVKAKYQKNKIKLANLRKTGNENEVNQWFAKFNFKK